MQTPYGAPPGQVPAAQPKRYDGKNGTPMYDQNHGGHYGASAGIAAQGHAPPPETFTGHWQNVSTRHATTSYQSLSYSIAGITRTQRTIQRHPQHVLAEPGDSVGD